MRCFGQVAPAAAPVLADDVEDDRDLGRPGGGAAAARVRLAASCGCQRVLLHDLEVVTRDEALGRLGDGAVLGAGVAVAGRCGGGDGQHGPGDDADGGGATATR